MAITASVQPESGRILYAGSDLPHPFQLRLSKEDIDRIVQNRPRSNLDGLVRVWVKRMAWKQTGVQESSGRFLAGRNRLITSFPLSDSVPLFYRRLG